MTVAYLCNGPDCDRTMGKDDRRIALTIENEHPITEPLEEGQIPTIDISFGFEGDHHFCTFPCLAAWAYRQHLDGLPDGTDPPNS